MFHNWLLSPLEFKELCKLSQRIAVDRIVILCDTTYDCLWSSFKDTRLEGGVIRGYKMWVLVQMCALSRTCLRNQSQVHGKNFPSS